MELPNYLYYSKEHTWIRIEHNIGTIGITAFAQSELGEIVYADLPEVGNSFEQDEVFGSVEAIKTVSDLFMPLSGKVIESNEHLLKKPTSINEDPYQQGWMIKIAITNDSELDSLLTAEQYKGLIN